MELTAQNVHDTFRACLYQEGQTDTSGHIAVQGIMCNVGFNPANLEKNKDNIISMLKQLPSTFDKNGPGQGHSFLAACNNKDGEQWGEHLHMDQLFTLGQAIGRVECLLPRELWKVLPGGMPYYAVDMT